MRKEIFRVFLMSAAMSLYLLFGIGIVRAQQCGRPGLPDCLPKTTPKKTTPKKTSPKLKINKTQVAARSQADVERKEASTQNTISKANDANDGFITIKGENNPLKVLADWTANGWTNSGVVVRKGQRVRISATGRVSLGQGRFATPAGVGSIADNQRLMPTIPTGALIAVIGDDNNDFIFVGSSREFTAPQSGMLFLGINESNLDDNSGAYDVVIKVKKVSSNGSEQPTLESSKDDLDKKFRDNRTTNRKVAYEAAKEYLAKFSNDYDNQEYVEYL
ncbi:MAG TPA: hypothetical protein VF571_01365, partial [Pyrinomonadaceae bacterium]